MRILLTNDDGINAEGLAVLEKIAHELSDDVWVVAPETDQSGKAHSLTLTNPLRVRALSDKKFAVNATPTDCVIMAMGHILDKKPDLVLSGVNLGANLAHDITYSGTVSAALEATLSGVRSIALSLECLYAHDHWSFDWSMVEQKGAEVIGKLIALDWPDKTLMNVNFPACSSQECAGIDIVPSADLTRKIGIKESRDGRDLAYYWMCFNPHSQPPKSDSDVGALKAKKIAITPLKVDLTDYNFLDCLKQKMQ